MSTKQSSTIRYARGPKRLTDTIVAFTGKSFGQRGFAESRVLTDWPMIVGEALAAHSLPSKLMFPKQRNAEGTLHVMVEGAWALQITHLEPIIIEKIATYFGYKAVAELRLMQVAQLPRKAKAAVRPAPVPLAPAQQKQLAQQLVDIEDAELREALERLGACVLSNTKKQH